MAFKGRKVADIYAELHLDRDTARDALRGLSGALGPDADKAGQDLGKKVTDGLARAVEASSARLVKARRAEVEATKAVQVAELRLGEARETGKAKASQLLALENSLEKAQYRLSQAQSNTVTSTRKLDDAQKRLAVSLADVGKNAGPAADRAGRDLGSKLSQGIHLSVVRNSPLIAAAIAAGLAVGAPVALAGATALFAGIGIVAAAQSDKVQSTWLGTWQAVKAGAIEDAAVIEPVLVRMADRVGDGFERMRPRLRGAFEDAAPQIEVFTGGILDLAENALPGLVRAVERGMPVTQGFADFLGKTGTGLSDFFDNISEHSPAAGAAFSSLGDIMGELLPMVGELLGQGAELAADVLPAVSGTLGVANAVLDRTGSLLPTVVQGFVAFKIAQVAGGWVSGLSTQLGTLALRMGHTTDASGRMTGAVGKTQTLFSRMGTAIPIVGAAVIALEAAFSAAGDAQDSMTTGFGEWFAAVRQGGAAADEAQAKIDTLNRKLADYNPEWGGVDVSEAFQKAADAAREYEQNLTPIEAAQQRLDAATRTLSETLGDENATTAEVAAAQREFEAATAESERANADLETAIYGVTDAMIAQTDAIFARADADLNLRNSIDAQEDAFTALNEVQKHLNDTNKDTRTSLEDLDDAGRAWEGTLNSQVGAARRLAEEALPAAMDANQKKALSDYAALDALRALEAQYGTALPPAIAAQIPALEAATASYDRGKLQADALSAGLDELGNKRPTPIATLDDRPFSSMFGSVLGRVAQVGGQRPTPIAFLNSGPFANVANWMFGEIGFLAGQRPTPVGQLNAGPFANTASWMSAHMGWLGAHRASPVATLYASTGTAEGQLNYAARNRVSYVTQYVDNQVAFRRAGGATGGKVSEVLTRGFASGGSPARRHDGKLSGPGGPLDDLIPARVSTGEQIHVSPTEWIVNAMASSRQGDAKMAALNAGRADIVMRPPPPRGFAEGGRPVASTASLPASDVRERGGTTIHIGTLRLEIPGAFNLGSGADRRRLIAEIRDGLVSIEREQG